MILWICLYVALSVASLVPVAVMLRDRTYQLVVAPPSHLSIPDLTYDTRGFA